MTGSREKQSLIKTSFIFLCIVASFYVQQGLRALNNWSVRWEQVNFSKESLLKTKLWSPPSSSVPAAELKPVKGGGYYRASKVPQYLSEAFYHRHHIPLSIKFNASVLILMFYSLKNKALRKKNNQNQQSTLFNK